MWVRGAPIQPERQRPRAAAEVTTASWRTRRARAPPPRPWPAGALLRSFSLFMHHFHNIKRGANRDYPQFLLLNVRADLLQEKL